MTSALRRLFVGGAFAVALLAHRLRGRDRRCRALRGPVAGGFLSRSRALGGAHGGTCGRCRPDLRDDHPGDYGRRLRQRRLERPGLTVHHHRRGGPGGIECVWANFDGPASDRAHIYGWAPIDEATADEARERLEAEGWTVEADPAGVYVTEPAETAVATDENGYGITYFFEAGTVKIADTKQSILLIEWG